MGLEFVRKTYETLGKEDPLFGVLSNKKYRHNKWDPGEFFRTGEEEIRDVLTYVDRLGLKLNYERALDFGCGVGRLSQALAGPFQEVVAVDISKLMLEHAKKYNRHGNRIHFIHNTTNDISVLASNLFDFIYSNITLQHIPPGHVVNYIREFFRVLRPGGLAVFQMPSGPANRFGIFGFWFYAFRRVYVRRFWQLIRGRPTYEMHYIARSQMEQVIKDSGGTIVDIVGVGNKRKARKNLRYCAIKLGPAHRSQCEL